MSNPTDQPLTMSAERLQQLRTGTSLNVLRDREFLREIDAQMAAHAETRERDTHIIRAYAEEVNALIKREAAALKQLAETREQLRVLEDELHRLRDIAIPKFQIHRERLEEQLAEAQKDTEQLREAGQNIAYYMARISPPPYGHACRWCGDCVERAKNELRAALRTKPDPPDALASSEEPGSDSVPFPGGRE